MIEIQNSLGQARWVLNDPPLEQIQQLARQHSLPEILARILVSQDIDDVTGFLNPTLQEHFPDPFSLHGMEDMANEIAKAIIEKKNIAIFGDFDVDGATSSAILYHFLKACGIEAPIYIPGRLTEGYGPNIDALKQLKDKGSNIVFLLDCGTTSFEIVQQGRDLGLDIIILDHHEAEENLPNANHVINPKRKDDGSKLDVLAACGVTFLACVAINNKLRALGFYKEGDEPNLKMHLDLVALGTVCDMVPLLDVNRLFVKAGFKQINKKHNIGLKALIEVSSLEGIVQPYHAGYVLGPRINAGSRVHQSDLGAKLLSTSDEEEARNIAWTLNDCNDKRKALQIDMQRQAEKQVEEQGLDQYPVIFVVLEDGHTGLSGLVAGNLKEKYKKPACVIAMVESAEGIKEGRGSGRSIAGIHIAQAFIDARNEGLLEKGGGHAMAGGFTLHSDKIEAFQTFLYQHIQKQMESADTSVHYDVAGLLSVQGTQIDFAHMIEEQLGPFGQEYPEPLFLFSDIRIHLADILGEKHIKLMISDQDGTRRLKAMSFGSVGTPIGDAFLKEGRQSFHLLGHLKINRWQGRESVEIHIKDAAFVYEEDRKAMAG